MAVHMAGTGLLAVLPAIAIPTGLRLIAYQPPVPPAIAVRRYVLFRTRAPPAA